MLVNLLTRNGFHAAAHQRHQRMPVRTAATVALQLDYYMSAQFAGVAQALKHNLYEERDLKVDFLPICPVGLEMERVRNHSNQHAAADLVTVGSVEQNVFIPLLYKNPDLKLRAIAAMFRRSPLALASLASNTNIHTVGAHEDTVELLRQIWPDRQVLSIPRATKNTDLKTGKLDAIQTYTTTEVPTLQRQLGADAIRIEPVEGANGALLGYSQMLFATQEDLARQDGREIVQAFLDATFKGWEMAIRDNEGAAKSVKEAQSMLGLDDENNDHWEPSSWEYQVDSVGLCCNYVKETFQGDRYGVINPKRWNEATQWLLNHGSKDITAPANVSDASFGLDPNVWQPSSQLMAGGEMARTTLEKV